MKKFILSLGLIAAAFNLTNCSQNDDFNTPEQGVGIPFEIVSTVTRTINDGVNTLWKEGDDLVVFHTESGSTTFINDEKFSLTDAATGTFKGSLKTELTAEAYDWFVSYPYYSGFTKPGTSHTNTFGCKRDGKQTQKGNNNSAHLSGSYLPLFGVAKGVAANETPAIKLQNAASFAKFIITNKLNEPITITSVEMKAEGYSLVGEIYIKFAEEPVSYNPTKSNTSDTALLEVKNGEAIAAGDKAEFYLAVAPFSVSEGSTVSFTISATNGAGDVLVCTKSVTPTAGWGFTAGKYKEINFGFEAVVATVNATTADATDTDTTEGTTATLNGSYTTINATDSDVVTCGFEYKPSDASTYTSVVAESAENFSYALTGLTVGGNYTFRAWASLDGGATKSYGEEKSFVTTKVSAELKDFSITKSDFAAIGVAYGYADSDVKTISTASGFTWTAYKAYRGKTSDNIRLKIDDYHGYLASPVVNGSIKKIELTCKGGGANSKMRFYSTSETSSQFAEVATPNSEKTYEVEVPSNLNLNQIYIRSGYGANYIYAVTIYYE